MHWSLHTRVPAYKRAKKVTHHHHQHPHFKLWKTKIPNQTESLYRLNQTVNRRYALLHQNVLIKFNVKSVKTDWLTVEPKRTSSYAPINTAIILQFVTSTVSCGESTNHGKEFQNKKKTKKTVEKNFHRTKSRQKAFGSKINATKQLFGA